MTASSNLIVLLAGITLLACADSRRSPPDAEVLASLEGTFAFASEAGSELLSLGASETPHGYTAAVCREGAFPVRYVRTQRGNANSTHRQLATNFASEPGDVYQLRRDSVSPDASCFVTTDAFVSHLIPVDRSLEASPCAEQQSAQLARIARRSTLHCWRLVALGDGSEVIAAQFAHVDTTALAAVALMRDGVQLFLELPGRYTAHGTDIWRVDDGGVFDPAAIRLLFAAQLSSTRAMALAWAGAEGESLQLIVADSTVEARTVLRAYRYWSPL